MNLAPLQLAPVYATAERGGVGQYQNVTETSYRMKEQVNLANDVYKYQTPYELLIAKRYPDAHFAIFDMYSLVRLIRPSSPAWISIMFPLLWLEMCIILSKFANFQRCSSPTSTSTLPTILTARHH